MARTDVQMKATNPITDRQRQVLSLLKEARALQADINANLETLHDGTNYAAIVPYLGLELGGVEATAGAAGALMTILNDALTALDSGAIKTLTDRLLE